VSKMLVWSVQLMKQVRCVKGAKGIQEALRNMTMGIGWNSRCVR